MVFIFRKNVTWSSFWVSSHDRLSDFHACSWQASDSAIVLLIARLVLSCVALGTLVWSVWESPNPYWLIFLTNWGILLINMMCISGLAVSVIAFTKSSYDSEEELPWYVSMYWAFYNVTVTTALTISALYWILLFDAEEASVEDPRMLWLDIVTHGFNSVIALFELFLSRTPVKLFHVYQPLGVGLWYAAFTVIYYAAGGTDINGNPFVYAVLDWREGGRTGALIAASSAGMIGIYVVVWALALGRDKLSSSLVRTTSHDFPFTPSDSDVRGIM